MIKTEIGYNEDDFVERDGRLEELTVTITLCEYRNLIADRICAGQNFHKSSDEYEGLKQAFKDMVKYVDTEKIPYNLKCFIESITGEII